MGQRLDLQTLLEELLGSRNVYFQPPSGLTMKYPCIVYAKDYRKLDYADNSPYRHAQRYSVTSIDINPDSETPGKIAMLPMVSFERAFVTENLNHEIFNLYF